MFTCKTCNLLLSYTSVFITEVLPGQDTGLVQEDRKSPISHCSTLHFPIDADHGRVLIACGVKLPGKLLLQP